MTYDLINDLCKTHKMSIKKLESELGFGNGSIKHGGDGIRLDRLIKIADYFGVPLDYFSPNKKEFVPTNPLMREIIEKASTLDDSDLKELLSFAGYIQSKH